MKVAAFLHAFPPFHNAGAEMMAHTLFRDLVRHGHDVTVLLSKPHDYLDGPYDYQGVRVLPWTSKRDPFDVFPKHDVVVTHLESTIRAQVIAERLGVPCVHLAHNTFTPTKKWMTRRPALAVFNSEWMAADYRRWFADNRRPVPRHVVVRPPIFAADYATTPGDLVTLVNLYDNKGGAVLWRIAARMPDVDFLAVKGGYGEQVLGDAPNVELIDNVPGHRMRDDVYARTRILLMPSEYESWGRAGVEAMCSGIPVVATPTPGLLESLGPAGTFVDRDDLDGWATAIRKLRNVATWAQRSKAARARAAELDPEPDLAAWRQAVESL